MKARFGISVLFAVLLSSFLAFYSIPRCEAAVAPVRIVWLVVAIAGSQTSAAAIMPGRIAQIAVIAMPQSCEAGVMEQLCSSVTNFLNEESANADADAKACKKNCGWKKRKDDLLDAAKKKAKESCAKGEAPDAQELSKGLDRNTKDRLKDLYDRNSRMFDGSAKLASKDFDVKSGQSPAITGKGGQVTDLKTSEPATPKLNSANEFGLSGTKLSGGISGLATPKQSPVLLASAALAKTSANTASTSTAKSLAAATASAKTADAADEPKTCAACNQLRLDTGMFSLDCMGICCTEGEISDCKTLCDNHYNAPQLGFASPCECYKKYNSAYYNSLPNCAGGGGECTAGKVTIDGPKDLLLSNPSTKSKKESYKVITTGKTPSKIKWSISNEKAKITSWWPDNNLSVKVIPVSESGPAKGDVTITAIVDNCPPASLDLTVRRPASVEHEPLTYSKFHKELFSLPGIGPIVSPFLFGGTKDGFIWIIKDQYSEPLKDVKVSEFVSCLPKENSVNCVKFFMPFGWKVGKWRTTNTEGQFTDTYAIPLTLLPSTYKLIVHQRIVANGYENIRRIGYEGISDITITESSIVGKSPVRLELK